MTRKLVAVLLWVAASALVVGASTAAVAVVDDSHTQQILDANQVNQALADSKPPAKQDTQEGTGHSAGESKVTRGGVVTVTCDGDQPTTRVVTKPGWYGRDMHDGDRGRATFIEADSRDDLAEEGRTGYAVPYHCDDGDVTWEEQQQVVTQEPRRITR